MNTQPSQLEELLAEATPEERAAAEIALHPAGTINEMAQRLGDRDAAIHLYAAVAGFVRAYLRADQMAAMPEALRGIARHPFVFVGMDVIDDVSAVSYGPQ